MKNVRLFLLLLLLALPAYSMQGLKVGPMLSAATVTGAGTTFGPAQSGQKSFQAVVTGTGTVTATVLIQVSDDTTTQGWLTLGTITLSGTTTSTDGFVSEGAWAYYRANVSAITGTGAAVTVTVAEE